MKKNLSTILFIGAAWGIFEASVGYFFHLAGIRLGWMIWFPVAYFFIHQAYRRTNSASSVMLVALIAASLKLINLHFPGSVDKVINPAVSIVIEALSVTLVYQYVLRRQPDRITPLSILLTGFLWRILYICYISAMPPAYLESAQFATMPGFMDYMFYKNIVTVALISAGFYAAKGLRGRFGRFATNGSGSLSGGNRAMHPALSAASIVLAAAVQVVCR